MFFRAAPMALWQSEISNRTNDGILKDMGKNHE